MPCFFRWLVAVVLVQVPLTASTVATETCPLGKFFNEGFSECRPCSDICNSFEHSLRKKCNKTESCRDFWPTTIPPSANSCPACVQPPPQISWMHMVLSGGLGTLLGCALCLVMCYFGITKKMPVPARLKRILHDYNYDEDDGFCDKISVDSNGVNIGYEELADTKVHSSNEDSSGVAKDGEKLMQINPVDECTGVYGGHNPQPMAFNAASDTSAVNKNNMDEQKGVETEVKTQIL